MRKIYLASASKPRERLFSLLGLKFKILASKVKEDRRLKHLSYVALVEKNALLKAKDAAKRVRH